MRLQVIVICHNRPRYLAAWLRAWRHCAKEGARLTILNTGGDKLKRPANLADAGWREMSNDGMDIGAVKQFIDSPSEDYDLLAWFPDDFWPMRKDFLRFYREPFADPRMGMVGTFWGGNAGGGHIRSGGVCLRRKVAEQITFPPYLFTCSDKRHGCYQFEYGALNFCSQIVSLKWKVQLVDGSIPPSCPHWNEQGQNFVVWDRDHGEYPELLNLFARTFPETAP